MKNFVKTTLPFALIAGFLLISCTQKKKRTLKLPQLTLSAEQLIPHPLQITATNSSFPLDKFTAIQTSTEKDFEDVGVFLAERIQETTQLTLQVNPSKIETAETFIRIRHKELPSNNPEAYELQIEQDSILLHATTAAGAFRGIQTLQQLLPQASTDSLADYKIWAIPTGKITDQPQFGYRAAMLDVARHFFSVTEVKKFINILSYYKYNILHLHLTDDQGWRIEIKAYPKLTEIGAQTEVGGESGGFYTQEEYSDIVAYAATRHITIVPEIDMPGHTNAASVSYPFLNGNGKPLKLYESTEVGFSTFDTKKDSVYTFIDAVIREVAALSPGPYFHIGGDESHATAKDDYNDFITKVAQLVKKHGKQMIGWDEIANAPIDSSNIAHFWNNKENAQNAVAKGMKIILSPAKKAYLDMKYNTDSKYGLSWAAYIPVDTAYNWSPESYSGVPISAILGIEAPLWTETVSNIDEVEYLAFPRAIGYAELGWSVKENRNWEAYKLRLANQAPYLHRMQVKYYPSTLIEWAH